MNKPNPQFEIFANLNTETSYGENPWQGNSGLYSTPVAESDSLALSNFEQVSGSALSFNNYCDADRLLQTVTHVAAGFDLNFREVPCIAAGAKHGNVCGAAAGGTEAEVLERMLDGDKRAIFGGSVMVNFALRKAEAQALMRYGMEKGKRLLDLVVAPEFDEDAVDILSRKEGKLRLLANRALGALSIDSLDSAPRTRYVRGGLLVQDNYDFLLNLGLTEVHSDLRASYAQEKDMILAWGIGATSNSNTITLVKNGQLIGNGVGQQDRVSAAELAIKRAEDAGHSVEGSTAYSDSFFPFPDGPQKLIDRGVSAILCSSGSVNDAIVFEAITSAGAKLYTVADKEGRGFYAH